MNTETKEDKKSVPGRKDAGQEAVVKLESLSTKVDHLIALHEKVATATNDYQDAVKAVAEASGLLSATVTKYVKARAGDEDKFEEAKTKALQLALVFEEVKADG